MLYIAFLVLPPLGAVWFYNLVVLLRNLKNEKDIHNQNVLGTVFTFIFVFLLIYVFLSVL
jgi:hypothetical protein